MIRFSKVLEGSVTLCGQALEAAGRAERESAVADLSGLLYGKPKLEAAVQGIRKAHSIIRRTGLVGERAKIEAVGLALGLSRDRIDLASRIYSLRNAEGLAHFGSGKLQRSDLNDARSAAHSYLTAYLRHAK